MSISVAFNHIDDASNFLAVRNILSNWHNSICTDADADADAGTDADADADADTDISFVSDVGNGGSTTVERVVLRTRDLLLLLLLPFELFLNTFPILNICK